MAWTLNSQWSTSPFLLSHPCRPMQINTLTSKDEYCAILHPPFVQALALSGPFSCKASSTSFALSSLLQSFSGIMAETSSHSRNMQLAEGLHEGRFYVAIYRHHTIGINWAFYFCQRDRKNMETGIEWKLRFAPQSRVMKPWTWQDQIRSPFEVWNDKNLLGLVLIYMTFPEWAGNDGFRSWVRTTGSVLPTGSRVASGELEDALMCLRNAHIITTRSNIRGVDAIRGLIFRATLRILEIGARQAMVAFWGERPVPLIDNKIWNFYFSA